MWDFVKNAVVDDINGVPENFRGLYVKDDASGKFKISDFAKGIVDAYVGTNTSLAKARADLTKTNGEAAARRVSATALLDFVRGLGIENVSEENPLEALQAHVSELVGKGKGADGLKVNLENIKKDYEKRNGELRTKADTEIAAMRKSLERHMIGNATLAALSKHGGNAVFLDAIVKAKAKVSTDENGEYSVRIVDDAGNQRSNGAGGWLDIDGYVAELKTNPVYSAAFASETKGGGGAPPKGAGGGAPPLKGAAEKSSIDKISAGLAKMGQK